MEAVLVVDGLVKSFGAFRAVDNVSLKVYDGMVTLLIGPNGSGKTTLLNCVTGLYKPDAGRILYKGTDLTGKKPHEVVREGLVRTFQISNPFRRLTVLENLLVSYRNNPGESPLRAFFKKSWLNEEKDAVEKAFKTLRLLDLEDLWDEEAQNLSGGQLKLLECGRALMTDAKMILMDEPAGSIAVVLAHQIFSHIRKLGKELGINFLLVEHRLDIAARYVDHVYAMARGRLISEGSPEHVFNDPEVLESYL